MAEYIESNWRRAAAPIIAAVLAQTAGMSDKVRRKALFDAYPFGMRQYHPYKIWLDEIAIQTGRRQTGKARLSAAKRKLEMEAMKDLRTAFIRPKAEANA